MHVEAGDEAEAERDDDDEPDDSNDVGLTPLLLWKLQSMSSGQKVVSTDRSCCC